MDNWKDRKRIHDTRICEHKTKKGNVYESEIKARTPEQNLLEAIFGESAPKVYMCKICKKWHTS